MAESSDLELKAPFSNEVLDLRSPCTALHNHPCQINNHLRVWNEFLFQEGFQLQEVQGKPGLLCLSSLHGEWQLRGRRILLHQWLLEEHHCIRAVQLGKGYSPPNEARLCNALRRNTSIKSLRFDKFRVDLPFLSKTLPDLTHLEELACTCLRTDASGSFVTSLCTLLRSTTSLTRLSLPDTCINAQHADTFLQALRANVSLKELSLHGGVFANASPGCREEFRAFLKNDCKLKVLTVDGRLILSSHWASLLLDALRSNRTLTEVTIIGYYMDAKDILLLQEIAARNNVLRKLIFRRMSLLVSEKPLLNSLAASFAENETLEELRLPIEIWEEKHWNLFFAALSAQGNGRKVIIDVRDYEVEIFLQANKYLRENDAAKKALFYVKINSSTADSIMNTENYLPQFDWVTSLELVVLELSDTWSIALVDLFKKTTRLKKVSLMVLSPRRQSVLVDWRVMFRSLKRNTTIAELSVEARCLKKEEVECLADAVKRSKNIRKGYFRLGRHTTLFLAHFARDIEDCYSITHVGVDEWILNENENWWRIVDTVRRNYGLVVRASHVLSTGESDRGSALALETVAKHPALMAELAEVMSVSDAELADMVRDGIRSINYDMHVLN